MDLFDMVSALPAAAALVRQRSVSVTVDLPAYAVWYVLTDLSEYSGWEPRIVAISGLVRNRERVTVLFADGRWSPFRVARVDHLGGFRLRGAGMRREFAVRPLSDSRVEVTVTDVTWSRRPPRAEAAWPADQLLRALARATDRVPGD
jgi:hypothetical protein